VFAGGNITSGVFLHFFGHLYLALGPNQLTHSFDSSFFRNYAKIRIFTALEWLSSTSVAKIMDKKTKISANFCTHKLHFGLKHTPSLYGQHLPVDGARELFKSALNRERLVV